MRKCLKATLRFSGGASLIELAIILPFLLLLAIGGIECVRFFNAQKRVHAVARQLVEAAFGSCVQTNAAALSSCLQSSVVTPVSSQLDVLILGGSFVLKRYRWNLNLPTSPLPARENYVLEDLFVFQPPGHVEPERRIDAQIFLEGVANPPDSPNAQMLMNHQTIFYVEVTFRHDYLAITQAIVGSFGKDLYARYAV